jgi:CHAT domain-containing protein
LISLPLHAAGIYEPDGPRLYNYVISSYTPSLTALLMSPKSPEPKFKGILAISQPQDGLPSTMNEIQNIQNCFSNESVTWLNMESATIDTVLQHMRNHHWVHFACHATQNIKDPTSSHLRLYGGDLSIARLMQESFNGEFAFLSTRTAGTATGDESLPDESVHIAAAIMIAGYPAVIGTLWSMEDKDAPLIAQEVYSHLYNNGNPDSSQVACALHNAVARLRMQDEQNFSAWVPYVHLGK